MKTKTFYNMHRMFTFTNQFHIWNRKEQRQRTIKEKENIISVKKKHNKLIVFLEVVWLFCFILQILNAFLFQSLFGLIMLFISLRTARGMGLTGFILNKEVNIGDYCIEERYDYDKICKRTKKEMFISILKVIFLGIDDDRMAPTLHKIKSVHLYPEALKENEYKDLIPLVVYIAEIVE